MTPEERAARALEPYDYDRDDDYDGPDLVSRIAAEITDAVREAVEREREACAEIAERYRSVMHTATVIAKHIRARSTQEVKQ